MELLSMRHRHTPRARLRAFTLIELVMVIVLTGIVFVLGGMVMGRAFESYDLARQTTAVDWQGRVALERMVRELRSVRSPTATDLALSGTEVRFNNDSGDPVCFQLAGSTLRRSADGPAGVCGATTPQPLADGVVTNGLSFFYYDNAGNATAVATDVYYISVMLQVAQGNINETYRVTVQPERF